MENSKQWEIEIKAFKAYLKLEKNLSENSVIAYLQDIEKLMQFSGITNYIFTPVTTQTINLQEFINWIASNGISARSQARIISAIKSFYHFLSLENKIIQNPSTLIETPKIGKYLPEVLSVNEIDTLISKIDLSKPEGHRNKAIIETLYSCGLRVTELINLRISNLFFSDGFVKITGKGNKERLVPIGEKAIQEINFYYLNFRNHLTIKKNNEDFVFLNRRGSKLTREMIFTIIKQLAIVAEIGKNISPHTFRHSFASHLIEGGADLRAVQQMLGHESIITTEIYTHLEKSFLRDTIMQHHPRIKNREKFNL